MLIMINSYHITHIENGQYKVAIDLAKWLPQYVLSVFIREFNRISSMDEDFNRLCSLNGTKLRYISETLLPENYNMRKEKILIVLGNPATHSVAGGMFFYSRKDGNRHQFWGKLEEAGLMPRVRLNSLEQEAMARKKLVLGGTTSDKYVLGLTTFYSFPTPVHGDYQDVKGVEKLFRPILGRVQRMEIDRLLSYSFSQGACFVFTQKSSWHCASSSLRGKNRVYWPLRGSGSGGADLCEQLNKLSNERCRNE